MDFANTRRRPTFISSICVLFSKDKRAQVNGENELEIFKQLQGISAIIAAYIIGVTLLQEGIVFSHSAHAVIVAVICSLLCLNFILSLSKF